MKLIIVRHGATDYNIKQVIQGFLDIPLNEQGRLQAQELGRALRSEKIDKIFCSDLKRAKSTADAILQQNICTEIEYHQALRERNYGEFQGKHVRHIIQAKQNYTGNEIDFEPDNGESELAFHQRIGAVWRSTMQNSDLNTVLYSVHGGVAKSLIIHAQNKDLTDRSTLIQDNCCLNILEGDYNNGFTAVTLNNVAHLSRPTGMEGL